MIASSTFSMPPRNAATPAVKDSRSNIKDILVLPDVSVDEHPGLHEPHAVGITLLDGLHHAVTAAAQILRVHRLGLRLREGGGSHVHLHEEIAVIEVGGGAVEGGAVKEEEEKEEDIIAP